MIKNQTYQETKEKHHHFSFVYFSNLYHGTIVYIIFFPL